MATKKFTWDEGKVIYTFNLKRLRAENMSLLTSWINAKEVIDDIDSVFLEKLRQKAELKIDSWNEEELKMNYLSFIVAYANYDDDAYNIYFERPLVAQVEGQAISVIVDFMIAKGVQEYIQTPYFCFHEYKRAKKYNDDPVAQVLLAMLAAKEINQSNKPLYGAYIIGRNWYFMVLEGKTFAISKTFDCTEKEDLYQIIAILREFKTIIKTTLL